jgi:archaellum component FlaF (FlaF/FlaG flagellin family)
MTSAAGDATTIQVPEQAGSYRVHVVDSAGTKVDESGSQIRVE